VKQVAITDAINQGAAEMGQDLSADELDKLAHLLGELRRWGQRVNLTAILDPAEMVAAHALDSLSVRPFIEGSRLIDVGTGAGFPGLPLSIVEPGINFQLLDSNGKKISFVTHMIGELGLTNVTAVKGRAEDYAPGERFDTVIARALASTHKLLKLCGHLVREDGVLLAQKGKHPAAELEALKSVPGWGYCVTELTVPGLAAHERHVVSLRRNEI
jgi:16S rRNA (guanine527-N7)-methyltransferase